MHLFRTSYTYITYIQYNNESHNHITIIRRNKLCEHKHLFIFILLCIDLKIKDHYCLNVLIHSDYIMHMKHGMQKINVAI